MSMDNHLSELERRRDMLKKQIAECESHPSADQVEIARLKRQKLQLKDEIHRLRVGAPQLRQVPA